MLLNNYVLIKSEDYKRFNDIELNLHFKSRQRNFGNLGTVLEVPNRLICNGKEVRKLLRHRTEKNIEKSRLLTQKSINHDTPIEVKKGDIVAFSGISKIRPFLVEGKGLLVRYDELFYNVTQNKALNNYVVFRHKEKDREEEAFDNFFVVNDDLNNYGEGIVVSASCLGGRLDCDYPPIDIKEGQTVLLDKRLDFGLATDHLNT